MSQTVFETWHLDLQELLGSRFRRLLLPLSTTFLPESIASNEPCHRQRRMDGPEPLRRVAYSGSRARKAFS